MSGKAMSKNQLFLYNIIKKMFPDENIRLNVKLASILPANVDDRKLEYDVSLYKVSRTLTTIRYSFQTYL
jgi:hypothetical protein